MEPDLDELLDQLPAGLARKVAAALAPDAPAAHDSLDTTENTLVTGYAPVVEPCPVSFTQADIDSYFPHQL